VQKEDEEMNTNNQHGQAPGSAMILQFPVGGRAAYHNHREGAAVDRSPLQGLKVMYGSSWYHDEAIEQSLAPNKS
jgi:hypothetical protein